ncbi:DUF4352 domain-containing protein [Glycomyces sp. L485]|uniref:DUF4352 domain-containing protein n=1 Tax=Glycomyces sp. L485 TaxID=2909235 RepID=UPI001F4B4C64|nr:DUF4352 domain-containing protein [Glycomyces sp. L485]MCH7232871.1 DUF4352 domain-containing protein [Glycomyces sp. L485]
MRTKWVIFASIAALLAIACGGGGDDGDGDTGADPEELSTTGRDGQFEFTVDSMECGDTEIGEEPLTETAQGQFCMVTLTVENVGDEPRTLSVLDQKAFDDQDHEYAADESLTGAVENPETWFTEINPGNSVTGTLVFDVPKDTELVRLELHDSAFSDGVEVAVP